MEDVSPMMTQEAGAGPRVNRTEMISPRDACAKEADLDTPTEAAIPRMNKKPQLIAEPQT